MANRYWISGGDGLWSSTNNWSTTSGGASGASAPGSADTVIFNSASGSGTATVDSNVTIQTLTMTGFTGTLAFGTNTISLNSSGAVYTGDTTYSVTGTPVINVTNATATATTVSPGAVTEANSISFNFTAGTYTLTFLGTANHAARNINFTGFLGTWAAKTVASTIYGDVTWSVNMTLVASTGVITFGSTGSVQTLSGGTASFPNPINMNGVGIKLIGGGVTPTLTINGAVTLTNGTLDCNGAILATAAAGISVVTGSVTITNFVNNANPFTLTSGTLTLGSNATMSAAFTQTAGTLNLGSYTLTCVGAFSSSNSNTRTLNFGTGKVVLNGSATATIWNTSTVTGLTVSGTPLVECRGGGTSVTKTINTGTLSESNAISFSLLETTGTAIYAFTAGNVVKNLIINGVQTISNIAITIYGSFTHQTTNGTTTFTAGTNAWTFGATSGSYNITNIASFTYDWPWTFGSAASTATWVLQNNLILGVTSRALTFASGTFDFNNKALSGTYTITINNTTGGTATLSCTNGLGVTFASSITHTAGAFSLNTNLYISVAGGTGDYTLTAGTLLLNSYTLNTRTFTSSNSNTRSINFGTGKIVLNGALTATVWNTGTNTNFSVSGTPLVECQGGGTAVTKTINTGTITEAQAISFSFLEPSGSVTFAFTAGNGFKNLIFNGSQTISNVAIYIYGSFTHSISGGTTTFTAGANAWTFAANSGNFNITPVYNYTYDFPWYIGYLAGSTATWSLQDTVTLGATREFRLVNGTFDLNNKTITAIANVTLTGTSVTLLNSTGTAAITTAATAFVLVSGTLTLGSNITFGYGFNLNPSTGLTGVLNLGTYTLTATYFSSILASNTRTINFGTGKIVVNASIATTVFSVTTAAGFSISGVPLVECTGGGSSIIKQISMTGFTEAQAMSFSFLETGTNVTYQFVTSVVFKNLILNGRQTIDTVTSGVGVDIYGSFTHLTTGGTTIFNGANTSPWRFSATSGSYNINNIAGFTYEFPWVIGSVASTATWTLQNNLTFGTTRPLTFGNGTFDLNNKTLTVTNQITISGTNFTLNSTGGTTLSTAAPISHSAGIFNLGINLTTSSTSGYAMTSGTLSLGSYTLTTPIFSSSNSNTRTLNFGTGKIVLNGSTTATIWNFATVTGLTVTGTPLVECIGGGTTVTKTINTGTATESQAISFSLLETTGTVTYAFTASNAVKNLIINGSQTVSNIAISIYGLFTHATTNGTTTFTAGVNAWTFAATSGNYTINHIAGFTYDFPWTFGVATSTATWSLGANLTLGATRQLTLTNGIFDMNNKTISAAGFTIITGTPTLANTGGSSPFTTSLPFTHTSGSFTLPFALTITSTSGYTLTSGTLALGTYTLTTPIFSSNTANTRSISFGTGKIVLNGSATATIWDTTTTTGFTTTGTQLVESIGGGTGVTKTIIMGNTNAIYAMSLSLLETTGTVTYSLSGYVRNLLINGSQNISSTLPTVRGNFTHLNTNGNTTIAASAGTFTLVGDYTSPNLITPLNGFTYDFPWSIGSVTTNTFSLQANLTLGATRLLSLRYGTLDLNGYTVSAASIAVGSSGTNAVGIANTGGGAFTTTMSFTQTAGIFTTYCDVITTGSFTLTAGTLSLGTKTLTTTAFSSNNANTRAVDFGTGKIVLNGSTTATIFDISTTTGLTISGTPLVECRGGGTGVTKTINLATGASEALAISISLLETTGTVTYTFINNCSIKDYTVNGSQTITNSQINLFGSFNHLTTNGTTTFSAGTSSFIVRGSSTNGSPTINTLDGFTYDFPWNFTGYNAATVFTLQKDLTLGSTKNLSLIQGILDLNNKIVTCSAFISNYSTTRILAFGTSGQVKLVGATGTVFSTATATNFSTTGTVYFNASTVSGTKTFSSAFTEAQAAGYNVVTSGTTGIVINANDTLTLTGSFNNVDLTGFTGTLANSTTTIYGNLTIPASGGTYTAGTNAITFATSTTSTITSNGRTLDFPFTFNGTGSFTLDGALTIGSTRLTTLTSGTLNLNNNTLSTGFFNSSGSLTRTLAFGTGQLSIGGTGTVFDITIATNFSTTGTVYVNTTTSGTKTIVTGFNETQANAGYNIATSGTSGIIITPTDIITLTGSFNNINLTGFTGTLSNTARTVYGNWTNPATGITFTSGNIDTIFASSSSTTITTNGATLYFPLRFSGTGTYTLAGSLTIWDAYQLSFISGTLNLNNNTLTCGYFVSSNSNTRTLAFGTSGQIFVNNFGGVIFDISTATNFTTTGTPYINTTTGVAGTKGFSLGFSEAQAVGYNVAVGGTSGIVLLATNDLILTGSFNDVNLTGFTGTLSNTARTIYGNWTTPTTGGTYTAGTAVTTFGTTSSKTITSNGRTLDFPLTFDGVNGTWTLQDILTIGSTRALAWNNGTLDINNKNISGPASATISIANNTGNVFTLKNTGASVFSTSSSMQLNVGTFYMGVDITTTSSFTFQQGSLYFGVGASTGQKLTAASFALGLANARYFDFKTTGAIYCTGTGTVFSSGNNATNTFSSSAYRPVYITSTGSTAITVQLGASSQTSESTFDFYFTGGTYALSFLGTNGEAARNVDFTGYSGTWGAIGGNLAANSVKIFGGLILSSTMTLTASAAFLYFGQNTGSTPYNWNINNNGKTLDFPIIVDGLINTLTLQDNFIHGSTRAMNLYSGTLDLNNKTFSGFATLVINGGASSFTLKNTGGTVYSTTLPITHTSGTLNLNTNITTTSTSGYTFTAGTLSLGTYTLTTTIFSSSNVNARTINFGTGKIVLNGSATATIWTTATVTNLTIAGTPLVECQGGGSAITKTINTGTLAEANAISFSIIETHTSGTITYAFTASNAVKNLTIVGPGAGGTTTISNLAISIYGSFTNTAGAGTTTFTAGTNVWTFAATSGNYTIISNTALTYDWPWTFGTATSTATWTLGSNITYGITRTLTLTGGTLALSSYILSTGLFSSNNSNTRTLDFGTGKIVLNGSATATVWTTATVTGLTIAGTPLVECQGGGSAVTKTITPGALSEAYAISFSLIETTGTVTYLITTASTIKNLVINGTQTLSNTPFTIYGHIIHLTNNGTTTFSAGTNTWTLANSGTTSADGYYGSYFNNKWIQAPASSDFSFTGDFTIEGWMYLSLPNSGFPQALFQMNDELVTGLFGFYYYNSGGGNGWCLIPNNNTFTPFNAPAATPSTWYHVAIVRSGSTITLYVNGVAAGTPITNSNTLGYSNKPFVMGAGVDRFGNMGNTITQGYLSNVRVCNGLAVYTGNFTVPTGPLTATQSSGTNISAITGTQCKLLAIQSPTVKDNSSFNRSLTVYDSTSTISAFNPFQNSVGSVGSKAIKNQSAFEFNLNMNTTTGTYIVDGGGFTLGSTRGFTLTNGTIDFNNQTFSGPTSGIIISTGSSVLKNLSGGTIITHTSGNLTLGSDLTLTGNYTLTAGTLSLGTYTLTTPLFSSNNSNTRSINFGTSKIVLNGSTTSTIWNMATVTGLTVAGTPLVECIGGGTGVTKTISPGPVTEAQAISFSLLETTGTVTYTITTLTSSVKNLIVNGSQTLTNSNIGIYGSFTHLTTNGATTFSAGTNAWVFAATSGSYTINNISGFTYDFPWTFGSATSTATWTLANNLTLGATRALTFTNGTLDWNNKTLTGASGITILTGSSIIKNTGGTTFNANALAITHTSGNLTLNTNITTTAATGYTLTAGTLNLSGYNLTIPSFITAAGTKNLTFNGGTLSITGSSTTSFNNAVPTGFTTTAGSGIGKISMTGSSTKTFVGGGSTYNCTLSNDGLGALIITGSNTFNNITNTVSPTSIIFTSGTTTYVNGFSVKGTSGNLVNISSSTNAAHYIVMNSLLTFDCDYLFITNSNLSPYPGYAGSNSFVYNSSGWNIYSTSSMGDSKVRTTSSGSLLLKNVASNPISGALTFNGSSQYLTLPSATNLDLGTGDFTIECWFKSSSTAANQTIISNPATPNSGSQYTTNHWAIQIGSAGTKLVMSYQPFGIGFLTSTTTVSDGLWRHMAISRYGDIFRMFINGILESTYTSSAGASMDQGTPRVTTIGSFETSNFFNGSITNLRVVKGVAVYKASFIPSTSALDVVTNTALLLKVASDATKITDSSSNISVVNNGAVGYSTNSPFYSNSGSLSFNGTSQGLIIPTGTTITSENFTVEGWINIPSTGLPYKGSFLVYTSYIVATDINNGFGLYIQSNSATDPTPSSITLGPNGSPISGPVVTASGLTISLNTWHHIAASRNGTDLSLWLDGTRIATVSGAASSYTSYTDTKIGYSTMNVGYTGYLAGYISNFRLVRNAVVYDPSLTSITVPTSPLTAVSGTDFLLNTSSDSTKLSNSPNNYTITNTGSVSYSTNNPFYSSGGSLLLDNSSKYLSTGSTSLFNFGTGDYTVEGWFNWTNVIAGGADALIQGQTSGSFQLYWDGGVYVANKLVISNRITNQLSVTWTPSVNTWYHIAAVRRLGVTSLYVNGVNLGSAADTTNYNVNSDYYIGADTAGSTWNFPGYITNLRIVNGTALYKNDFTPPKSALQKSQVAIENIASVSATNTSLLVVPDVYTPISDESLNGYSISGSATYSNLSPFITGSLYFNGSSCLYAPNSAGLASYASDFTVELWMYPTTYTGGPFGVCGQYKLANGRSWIMIFGADGSIQVQATGLNTVTSAASVIQLNKWYHIAWVKNGSTWYLYVNGIQVSSAASGTPATSTEPITIGANNDAASPTWFFPGYITNFRIVKGAAVYTSNFTKPDSPLVSVYSGSAYSTALLLNVQDSYNYLKDSSPNTFALTPTGSVSYNSSTPFTTSTTTSSSAPIFDEYTLSDVSPARKILSDGTYQIKNTGQFDEISFNSGSMYFNGTSDNTYLATIYSKDKFDWWDQDFTLETWIYPISYTDAAQPNLIGNPELSAINSIYYWSFGLNSSGYPSFSYYNNSSNNYIISHTSVAPLNTWSHIALVKTSSGITLYLNGVPNSITAINGTPISTNTTTLAINRFDISTIKPLNCYITNIRLVKGVAVYTGNFTPIYSILNREQLSRTNVSSINEIQTSLLLNVINSNTLLIDRSIYKNNITTYSRSSETPASLTINYNSSNPFKTSSNIVQRIDNLSNIYTNDIIDEASVVT